MRIESLFEVPGSPDAVMLRLSDVESVAQCLPGAAIEGKTDEGQYLGTIAVSLGPKKMVLRGQVRCEFDLAARTGALSGQASSNVRGARASGKTTFRVIEAPGSTEGQPVSRVEIISEAALPGMLAEFARTGGTAMANLLIAEFSRRLAADLAGSSVISDPADGSSPANGLAAKTTGSSFNLGTFFWQLIKARVCRLFRLGR